MSPRDSLPSGDQHQQWERDAFPERVLSAADEIDGGGSSEHEDDNRHAVLKHSETAAALQLEPHSSADRPSRP